MFKVICDIFRLWSDGIVGRWSGGVHIRRADQLPLPTLEPLLRLPLVALGLEVATKFLDSIYISGSHLISHRTSII